VRTLKQLRAQVLARLPKTDNIVRVAEVDKLINDAYRIMVKRGNLLKDHAITCGLSDQERYNLTSSLIWLPTTLTYSTGRVNGAHSASTTTIAVTDGTLFSAGQLILVSTSNSSYSFDDDEIMYIQSISSNDLTVIRGVAGSTAATIGDGEYIWVGAKPQISKIYRIDWDGYKAQIMDMDRISEVDVT